MLVWEALYIEKISAFSITKPEFEAKVEMEEHMSERSSYERESEQNKVTDYVLHDMNNTVYYNYALNIIAV